MGLFPPDSLTPKQDLSKDLLPYYMLASQDHPPGPYQKKILKKKTCVPALDHTAYTAL